MSRGPFLDLVLVAIRPAVAAVALMEPLLVLALQLVVQNHPFDARATLLESLGFT